MEDDFERLEEKSLDNLYFFDISSTRLVSIDDARNLPVTTFNEIADRSAFLYSVMDEGSITYEEYLRHRSFFDFDGISMMLAIHKRRCDDARAYEKALNDLLAITR